MASIDSIIQEFGHRDPDREYIERPGSYGLVVRDDALLIVEEESGWFLPGGGIEDGESPLEALHREMVEETGFRVDQVVEINRVRQYVIARNGDRAWAKDCYIFTAVLAERVGVGSCQLEWVSLHEAAARLAHECFRWVVGQAANHRS